MPATATPDQPIFYVYLHREADTGRPFYVGKGHGRRAGSSFGRSTWWKRIVAKHGFTMEIMAEGLTESQAFEFEIFAIEHFDGLCNISSGGQGVCNPPNWLREKFRQRQLGKSPSPITRQRLSEAHKKRPPFTAEHRANISASARKRGISPEIAAKGREKMARPVISEIDGKVYPSIRAAADHYVSITGRDRESIAVCISDCIRTTGKRGKRKTCGTTWRYADSGDA